MSVKAKVHNLDQFSALKDELPQIPLHSLAAFDCSTTQDFFLTSGVGLLGPR